MTNQDSIYGHKVRYTLGMGGVVVAKSPGLRDTVGIDRDEARRKMQRQIWARQQQEARHD